ncbi:hypothetical protein ATANTOWER_029163 [Ataeniobius toweri]|uniref:Uncharacterized protein n=1 Tax=Ataeniobius toweri TaxID=208326 RepID=A0ABU7C5T7_9TELE|nr:hypothetical protein [Ataeniobius toweri]
MIERPEEPQVKGATESATGEEMSEDEENDFSDVDDEDEKMSEREKEDIAEETDGGEKEGTESGNPAYPAGPPGRHRAVPTWIQFLDSSQ